MEAPPGPGVSFSFTIIRVPEGVLSRVWGFGSCVASWLLLMAGGGAGTSSSSFWFLVLV